MFRFGTWLLVCFSAALLLLNARSQPPFTYQGYLRDGGRPANGTYNMVFRLFSVPSGGVALQAFPAAGTVAVTTANGLFTQELPFNPVHFNGADLWLEIVVNGAVLSPRVKLNPAPYAIRALTASTAANLSLPFSGSANAGGAGSAVFFILNTSNDGGTVGIKGQANANSAGAAGVFGISFNDTAQTFGVLGRSTSTNGVGVFGDAVASSGTPIGVRGRVNTASGYAGFFEGGRSFFEGSVGVGTNSPAQKLDVVGTVQMTGFSMPTGAAANRVLTSNGSGVGTWQDLPAGANLWNVNGTHIFNTNTGNVGIGTNSPGVKLDVLGSLRAVNNTVNLSGNVIDGRSSGIGAGGNIIYAEIGNNNVSNTDFLEFQSGNPLSEKLRISGSGQWVLRPTNQNTSGSLFIFIGTMANSFGVPNGFDMTLTDNTTGTGGFTAIRAAMGAGGTGTGPKRLMHLLSGARNFIVDNNANVTIEGNLTVSGTKTGYVSDTVRNGGAEALEPGDLVEIIGYDVPILGEIPVIVVRKTTGANSTAVLGPIAFAVKVRAIEESVSSGEKASNEILETEGAVQPGEYGQVVTLGAFKMIKVDASLGAIRPGDLLVSSPTPGHAMKGVKPETGTVVGKALSSLDTGTGMIPVLVQSR